MILSNYRYPRIKQSDHCQIWLTLYHFSLITRPMYNEKNGRAISAMTQTHRTKVRRTHLILISPTLKNVTMGFPTINIFERRDGMMTITMMKMKTTTTQQSTIEDGATTKKMRERERDGTMTITMMTATQQSKKFG